eukprot:NODE_3038_length_502_cov_102.240618_g2630_i0.p1 GENE.NODE_3038_length_502_cov_102.240618_g2630_i0~~NODE_3038_length_502_cov_102.240618_g2630_i0.p1  ORF type:complete len:133 (-),score=17.20 NODE_3038_length_502_cov_102.240618_g2630_i0:52-450(-)
MKRTTTPPAEAKASCKRRKKPSEIHEHSVAKSPTPASPGDEISELFTSFKKKQKDTQPTEKKEDGPQNSSAKKLKPKTFHKTSAETDEFLDTRGSIGARKYVDGMPVYTLEELGVGKGGGTRLCPFDCDCCH